MKQPVLIFAAILHLVWAALVILSPTATNATTTSYLLDVLPSRYLLAAILTIASLSALYAVYYAPGYTLRTLALLIPQAIFVLLSATGATRAIITGQYADGVSRPWEFIAADQTWAPLIAIMHQWVLIRLHSPVLRQLVNKGIARWKA